MSNETSESGVENAIAGGVFLLVALSGFTSYVPVLVAVVRNKEMMSEPFYKLVVSLGISDCCSLFSWALLSTHIMCQGRLLNAHLQHYASNVVNFAWLKFVADLALIAFNRYCSTLAPKLKERFFGPIGTWLLIGLSIVVGGSIMIVPLFFCTYVVNLVYYVPFMFCERSMQNIYIAANALLATFTCVLSLSCYALILRKGRESARRVAEHRSEGGAASEKRKQKRMAFQAMFISLCFYVQTAAYYYTVYGGVGRWLVYATALFWEINFAVNPFIYLFFNSTLRKECRKLFCCN